MKTNTLKKHAPKYLHTVSVSANYPVVECKMSDGKTYLYDMTEMLALPGNLAVKLRDKAFFEKVFISEEGSLTWPNGFDLAPDKPAREGKEIKHGK